MSDCDIVCVPKSRQEGDGKNLLLQSLNQASYEHVLSTFLEQPLSAGNKNTPILHTQDIIRTASGKFERTKQKLSYRLHIIHLQSVETLL